MSIDAEVVDTDDCPQFDIVTGTELGLPQWVDDQDMPRFNLRERAM